MQQLIVPNSLFATTKALVFLSYSVTGFICILLWNDFAVTDHVPCLFEDLFTQGMR